MSWASTFLKFVGETGEHRVRKARKVARGRSGSHYRRLGCEPLEDRRLLSVSVVSSALNTADDSSAAGTYVGGTSPQPLVTVVQASSAASSRNLTSAAIFTPVFSSLSSPTISAGTATTVLSGKISLLLNNSPVTITLNGVKQTARVHHGKFSASFNTSALTAAGSPYTITYSYGGFWFIYNSVTATTKLTVTKVQPVFSGLSAPTISYGTGTTTLSGAITKVPNGETVSITVNGVTQKATVSSGTFSSSFNTAALGVAGSPYTITYAYAGDANLNAATNTSETLTVTKGVPVLRSLSGPTIEEGSATTTLSGTISLVPNGETVSITLGGVTQAATVSNGAFSSTFNTSALTAAGSPYAIKYSYAGDANLTAAGDTSHGAGRDLLGHPRLQQPERIDHRLRDGLDDAVGQDLAGAQRGDGFYHRQRRDADSDGQRRGFLEHLQCRRPDGC